LSNFSKPFLDTWDKISTYNNWIAEPKMDGMRCFMSVGYQGITLVRDDGKPKSVQFPEVIKKAQESKALLPDTIIDGEICILDSPLIANYSLMQGRMNLLNSSRINLLSNHSPAQFIAFDILKFEGKDLTKLPFIKRRTILEKFIPAKPFSVISQWKSKDLLKVVQKLDLEGIVLKEPNSTYDSIRQETWRKFKKKEEKDYIVGDFTSEKRPITSLELLDSKGNFVGKVNYTGYPQTEKMKKKLKGMTAVVEYMKSKGKLRQPVLKELREK